MLDRAAGRRRPERRDPAAAGPGRLRPHRRLRRRHRRLVRRVRRRRVAADPLPPTLHLAADRAQELRYGENPHQVGARYRLAGGRSWWDDAVQHGGKELSYLNLYDTEAAWRLVHELGDGPAAVVIKHANPCGVAVADDLTQAYTLAHECDPVSAFGGIVAVNRPMPVGLAEALAPVFTEVVVAPAYEDGALEVLTAKKNLRVLEAPPPGPPGLQLRTIDGGFLVQTPDPVTVDRSTWTVATEREPTDDEWRDLELAWRLVARVSSNAIVLVKDGQAVGIGAGQQNRRRRRRASPPRRPTAGPRAAPTPPTPSSPSPTASTGPPTPAPRRSSSPAARSATTRSSPPPTSTAWPWSSPANATSGTDAARTANDGTHGAIRRRGSAVPSSFWRRFGYGPNQAPVECPFWRPIRYDDQMRRQNGVWHGRCRPGGPPSVRQFSSRESGRDAIVLDGEAVAAEIKAELVGRIEALTAQGITPGLGTLLVGDDAPSARYVQMKHEDAAELGIGLLRRTPAGRRRPGPDRRGDRRVERRPCGRRLPLPVPVPAGLRLRGPPAARRPGQGRRRPAPGQPREAGHGQ